jgi:ElaB/YqjD/DUF883 family membrane-anchored ribosome-binding protein
MHAVVVYVTRFVHECPWLSVISALVIGLVIGLVLGVIVGPYLPMGEDR